MDSKSKRLMVNVNIEQSMRVYEARDYKLEQHFSHVLMVREYTPFARSSILNAFR